MSNRQGGNDTFSLDERRDIPMHINQHHNVEEKIDKLLVDYKGDYAKLLHTFIELGTQRNMISRDQVMSIVSSRFHIQPREDSRHSRFNSTQALKGYCRKKYKQNPSVYSKPPKNSLPKEEFVEWAKKNNIDISHFRTRTYNKRSEGTMFFDDCDDQEDDSITDTESSGSNEPPETAKSITINNLLN